ncbi:MAG: AmmeMemoRadiSam system protein B [Anaerolineales bacterium]|nr:AmmeMemoRadiSam system protein B [Anaerolineales bacterium]
MNPKLRTLDIRPYQQDGQNFFLVRDPLQITEAVLLIPYQLGPVLMLCNGDWDAHAMNGILRLQYGVQFEPEVLESVLNMLDEALLFENESFEEARARALAEYRQAPFRLPSLAGAGYPAEPADLKQQFDAYLEEAGEVPLASAEARGVLSPHIDYARGGAVYAQVWKKAAELARRAELVVLLGTDHYADTPGSLTLTRQNYATPYGVLPTAVELVDELAQAIGEEAAFAGELRHRGEHSLELVAVWLHHMRRGQPVPLVPVLTGSFSEHIQAGQSPLANATVQAVIERLQQLTAGKRVLYVASGDLSHVGPAFNGESLDAEGKANLQVADKEVLTRMCAGDAEGFYASIQRVGDANNVCGLSPVYFTLKALGATEGECVAYATCPADENNTSVVTVAGVVFE